MRHRFGSRIREIGHGSQLREITRLFDAGVIRPVMDRVFPFESTNEAPAYVEPGRTKVKVVVKVKRARDGLESGFDEMLADELTQQVKRGMKRQGPATSAGVLLSPKLTGSRTELIQSRK